MIDLDLGGTKSNVEDFWEYVDSIYCLILTSNHSNALNGIATILLRVLDIQTLFNNFENQNTNLDDNDASFDVLPKTFNDIYSEFKEIESLYHLATSLLEQIKSNGKIETAFMVDSYIANGLLEIAHKADISLRMISNQMDDYYESEKKEVLA